LFTGGVISDLSPFLNKSTTALGQKNIHAANSSCTNAQDHQPWIDKSVIDGMMLIALFDLLLNQQKVELI